VEYTEKTLRYITRAGQA